MREAKRRPKKKKENHSLFVCSPFSSLWGVLKIADFQHVQRFIVPLGLGW